MCLQLSISSSPHSPVLHQSLQILFYAATQIQAQTRDLDSAFSKLDEKKCHSVVFQEVLSPSCTTPFSFFSLRQLFTVTTTVLTQVTTLFDCVYVFKLLWHAFKKRETPFSVFEKQTKKKKIISAPTAAFHNFTSLTGFGQSSVFTSHWEHIFLSFSERKERK